MLNITIRLYAGSILCLSLILVRFCVRVGASRLTKYYNWHVGSFTLHQC